MARFRKVSLPALLFAAISPVMAANAFSQSNVGNWKRTLGGPWRNTANMVLQVPSGGFIVSGEIQFSGSGYSDAWVVSLGTRGRKE